MIYSMRLNNLNITSVLVSKSRGSPVLHPAIPRPARVPDGAREGLKLRHRRARQRHTLARARTERLTNALEKVGACNNQTWRALADGSGTVGVEVWSPGGDSGAVGDSVMRHRPRNARSTRHALCVNAASARAATIGGDVCAHL